MSFRTLLSLLVAAAQLSVPVLAEYAVEYCASDTALSLKTMAWDTVGEQGCYGFGCSIFNKQWTSSQCPAEVDSKSFPSVADPAYKKVRMFFASELVAVSNRLLGNIRGPSSSSTLRA